MANVLGLIFANMHEQSVADLTKQRTLASVPFGGRYRMIDFPLSNMVNSDIDNVGIITKDNYLSLMDHLGSVSYTHLRICVHAGEAVYRQRRYLRSTFILWNILCRRRNMSLPTSSHTFCRQITVQGSTQSLQGICLITSRGKGCLNKQKQKQQEIAPAVFLFTFL